MICTAGTQGELISITVAPDRVIALVAVGVLWDNTRDVPGIGQRIGIDFILDSSTLG